MSSWQNDILKDFLPRMHNLILAVDPDGLLNDEIIVMELQNKEYDILQFFDSVEFRFTYESQYRSKRDLGEDVLRSVILRLPSDEVDLLPFDLLQAGKKVSLSLVDFFPNLNYPVIQALDKDTLNLLYEVQKKWPTQQIGENATKDYILKYIFHIDEISVANEIGLLQSLLRLHYKGIKIPSILAERVIQKINSNQEYINWPLSEIIIDSEAFFEFLQERWPIFLHQLSAENQIKSELPIFHLKYSGPQKIPFDHEDIKVYLDNLFLEGKLTPVEFTNICIDDHPWVKCGIKTSQENHENERIYQLFNQIEKEVPLIEATYSEWISYAIKWAELNSLIYQSENKDFLIKVVGVREKVNNHFAQWLIQHYSSLCSLSPANPVMVHHIPNHLLHYCEKESCKRIALIVVDGLALDQWKTMRNIIQEKNSDIIITEKALFAWIPTLTSVSRQSIFSGKSPYYFESSINRTDKEEKLWKKFWEESNFSKMDIAYLKGLGDGNAKDKITSEINIERTHVLGLVIDKVDKIMHGMQLGSAGMLNQISQWMGNGFLSSLINLLIDYDFEVWLTADHGNIQCEGIGSLPEGVIPDTQGERVRVYPSPDFRKKYAEVYSFAHQWEPCGLPENYYPLVISGNEAFAIQGKTSVAHGGISLEEVIVPFIKFERKTNGGE